MSDLPGAIEPFSSDGPRRVFYDAEGQALTPEDFSSTGGRLRQKPDLAAVDGVLSSTAIDLADPGWDSISGFGMVDAEAILGAVSRGFESERFLRGDCNDDGHVDVSDVVCTLNWLFFGGGTPGCVAATNTNGDDAADLSDVVHSLGYLFLGGAPPAGPFPDCGIGSPVSDEELTCLTPPESCQ